MDLLQNMIISNTTISRPEPASKNPVAEESGGLSGKPLFELSTNILKEMYLLTRAIEQEAPEVIADAIEQEAPEHDSPDGIKQGNNGSQVSILKETSEIPICDIAANGISSCFVSHNTEFTGIQAALSKSKQQTEPGILLDFSMGEQQKLPTEIRNESIVVPQPVTKEEN